MENHVFYVFNDSINYAVKNAVTYAINFAVKNAVTYAINYTGSCTISYAFNYTIRPFRRCLAEVYFYILTCGRY